MQLGLEEILEATHGRLVGAERSEPVSSFHTDSREVRSGGLFFALRGAAMDGHAFLADAQRRGAAAVLVRERVELPLAQVVVEDTWQALYALATSVLGRV